MSNILIIALFLTALVAANLSVAAFGPSVVFLNAFFLIGLDLVVRDLLNNRLSRPSMLTLILSAGALSYLLNPASGAVAIASVVAFTAASLTDWLVFNVTSGNWTRKSIASNAAGAVIDSLIFPYIAFGSLLPVIVAEMITSKITGSIFWIGVVYLVSRKVRGAV